MSTAHERFHLQACATSGINVVLGLWLVFSPWIFNYGDRPALVSNVMVGALIALLAGYRIATWQESAALSAANLGLGLWTIVSPWTCRYAESPSGALNSVLVGILVASFAAWSAAVTLLAARHPPVGWSQTP